MAGKTVITPLQHEFDKINSRINNLEKKVLGNETKINENTEENSLNDSFFKELGRLCKNRRIVE